MTPTDFMLLVGGIILIGFLADELFRRKYIPDSIILILLGMILGHFTGLLPPETFIDFAGFMASIAVAIILYDTGLNLDLVSTLRESGAAFRIATISYFTAAFLITLIAYFFLRWDLISSLVLGAMLGGTSAAVVATIASKLPVSERTKIILNVESTLTNAYALVFVLTLIDFATRGVALDPLQAAHAVVSSLSVSIVIGLIAGILWLKVLSKIYNRPYVQMLTLGVMFLVYALTEYLKGIGAIAAFIFGLVLGNARTVKNMFFLDGDFKVSSIFKQFNDEISFFIRVFFFVFLGVIFVPPEDIGLYLVSILIVVAALLARYVAVYFSKPEDPEIVIVSFPRGLSEAVVASLLISLNFPRAEVYLQLASLVILLTNVATAVLLFYVVRTLYSNKNTSGQK
ncbi:MAG: hypothetical protein GXO00_02160 [Candidatus Diapherotrites archaeon]|nr:hypothetical protein [Candidatus Diapherotrites archaeon]